MFKLAPNPTFRAKVTIPTPGDAPDGVIEFEFRHKTLGEMKRYAAELQAPGVDDAGKLAEIIVGWSGVEEEYSRESLGKLIDNFPAATTAIVAGYVRELAGARLGN